MLIDAQLVHAVQQRRHKDSTHREALIQWPQPHETEVLGCRRLQMAALCRAVFRQAAARESLEQRTCVVYIGYPQRMVKSDTVGNRIGARRVRSQPSPEAQFVAFSFQWSTMVQRLFQWYPRRGVWVPDGHSVTLQ